MYTARLLEIEFTFQMGIVFSTWSICMTASAELFRCLSNLDRLLSGTFGHHIFFLSISSKHGELLTVGKKHYWACSPIQHNGTWASLDIWLLLGIEREGDSELLSI